MNIAHAHDIYHLKLHLERVIVYKAPHLKLELYKNIVKQRDYKSSIHSKDSYAK